MKNQVYKDLEIYTEKEVMKNIILGRPYRPGQNSILLLKKGRVEVNYGLRNYTLPPLTILQISPKIAYEFIGVDPEIELRIITFNPNFESLSTSQIRRPENITFFFSSIQNHYTIESSDFMELWDVIELLRGRLTSREKHFAGKEIIHHLFLSTIYLLADVSGKYDQLRLNELNRSERLTIDFTKHVSTYFRSERAVSFYANLSNVSAKHLSETVKACSGFTAGEIINQAILTEAKVLLVNPSVTINQVSSLLNFSDQYAFSKFFKRLTQISPSFFREKI